MVVTSPARVGERSTKLESGAASARETSQRTLDVLLLRMPFAPLSRPSIGLTLLREGLRRRGVSADILYGSLRFADIIGPAAYRQIQEYPDITAFIGDWVFADTLFPGVDPAGDYLQDILALDEMATHLLPGATAADAAHWLRTIRGSAAASIESCLEEILGRDPSIVGFRRSE